MLVNYQLIGLRALACVLMFLITTTIVFGQKIYVDQDASGADDGSSWINAFVDLQDALGVANPDDSIWVAEGTYYPSSSNVGVFYSIPTSVYLYGGFDGSETLLGERDIVANPTILSGDIDMDNMLNGGNSRTVVFMSIASGYSLLDGFTITGGYAGTGANVQSSGGGVFIDGGGSNSGIPIFRNVTFSNNYALNFGGAIYANGIGGGGLNYIVEHCKFIGNRSIFNGGAIQNDGQCSPSIINCEFRNNLASYGGAIYNSGINTTASPFIVNCIFSGNRAQQTGGAMFNFGKGSSGVSSPILFNCLIYDNLSDISAAGLYSLSDEGTSEMQVINTTFYNNNATVNGGHVYANASMGGVTESTLKNCIIWGSVSGSNPYFAFSSSTGDTPIINLEYTLVDASDCAAMYDEPLGELNCGPNTLYNVPTSNDPLFVNLGVRDFRLQNASPAIEYGDSTFIPVDFLDLDKDGNITEPVPVDLDWHYRVAGSQIDLGPFEANSTAVPIGLPVALVSFTTQPVGGKVLLDWVTVSEENNDYFSIERSSNGFDFEVIHREEGMGTTVFARHYHYEDNNPFAGKNYYRLKQNDLDGQFEYSDIRVVSVLEEGRLTTYPNPVTNTLHVGLSNFKVREVDYEIYHLSGKMMHSGQADVNEGVVVVDLYEVEQLVPGSYFIRIANEKIGELHGKFLKVGL